MDGIPNAFSTLGNAELLDPNIDVFWAPEALPNKLLELVVVAGVLVALPNVGAAPYGGGGGRPEFVCPNVGVGDENAPNPAVVGVPNCSGFVSIAGLLLVVNVNAPCVVVAVIAFVFAFAFAVLIFPNNGVALVEVAADPNVNTGVLVDVAFPNWKALVSRKIKRK